MPSEEGAVIVALLPTKKGSLATVKLSRTYGSETPTSNEAICR